MIRFTPLGAFNDPFEGRPEVTQMLTADELDKQIRAVAQAEAEKAFGALPEVARAVLGREQYSNLFLNLINNHRTELESAVQAATPGFMNMVYRKFDETVGALCLSEVKDSLLMWAHYADSHCGFVVEFNGQHPSFDARRGGSDEFRHLRRVIYRDTRPSGNADEVADELFTVKSSHWSYEREWRILQPLQFADKRIDAQPYPVCLFQLPAEAITAVILGARVRSADEFAIRRAIEDAQELSHVRVQRAKPDSSHFFLRFEAV